VGGLAEAEAGRMGISPAELGGLTAIANARKRAEGRLQELPGNRAK